MDDKEGRKRKRAADKSEEEEDGRLVPEGPVAVNQFPVHSFCQFILDFLIYS